METWRPIKGYENNYEISNFGRIKSICREGTAGGLRKLTENKDGYYQIMLCKEGDQRSFLVHRLVFEAFNGNIPEGLEINHIDENKKNNSICNLEVVTHTENVRHGTGIERSAKTMKEKKYFCKAVGQYTTSGQLLATFYSLAEANEATKVNKGNICSCCKGRQQTAGGYVWRYV